MAKRIRVLWVHGLRLLDKKILLQCPIITILSGTAFLLLVIFLHNSVIFAEQQESTFESNQETYVNSAFKFKIRYPSAILTNKTSEGRLDSFHFRDFKAKVYIHVSTDLVLYSPKEAGFSSVKEDEKRQFETHQIKNINFSLGYFIHYEGMGQWNEGINAITEHMGKYYVIAFIHEFQGLPQSVTEKDEIRKMRLNQLEERKDKSTQIFWDMLSSFEFTE